MELARRLLVAGIVSASDLGRALVVSTERHLPLALALVQSKAVTEAELEGERAPASGPALPRVYPSPELCARLPLLAARRLGAIPLRRDPVSGVVDVAALDPLDSHVARELAFHLGEPVRLLRARLASVEEALRNLEGDGRGLESRRLRCHTPASPHGAPVSWRPPSAAEEDPPASPIPLVRRSVPPPHPDDARAVRLPSFADVGGEHDPDGTVVLQLRSVKPSTQAATVARIDAVERAVADPPPGRAELQPSPPPRPTQRPAIVVDVPPPRTRPAGTLAPSASLRPPVVASIPPRSSAGRTLLPPGPLAVAAPAGAGAPRLRDLQPKADRPDTLDALGLEAEGLVMPAPRAGLADDFADVVALVRRAPSRDAVVDRVLRGLARVARRTAVFAVRRDGYVGWTCNEAFGDAAAFRAVSVPAEVPSLLRTAGTTAVYLGPVPDTAAHEGILRVMGRATDDVAAVSVRVGGRPVMVLLVDELEDSMGGPRRMDELARGAGEALARLLGAR